jgi:tagatose-1,6-bisphosphate aldolase non-catalytic subunit AgaZ/GatZ
VCSSSGGSTESERDTQSSSRAAVHAGGAQAWFEEQRLAEVCTRVIPLVVQSDVELDHNTVVAYARRVEDSLQRLIGLSDMKG